MKDADILLANILSMGEHATWQNCYDRVSEGLPAWPRKGTDPGFRRVYLVGCGTSFYAGHVGKYILERLTCLPVEVCQSFAFSHYADPALLARDTLVIGISTTGKTESTCQAIEMARRQGAATLAFTASPGSQITQLAETTIYSGGTVSVAVQTETYLQTLIGLYLIALEIAARLGHLAGDEREYWTDQFRRAETVTQKFLASQQPAIDALAQQFAAADMVFALGSGPNFGTAEEASLKVVEMAKMYSIGKEMEEFFHGCDRELNRTSPMFFIAPHGPAQARMLDFLTFNRLVGAPSIVLTCEDNSDIREAADQMILLQGDLDPLATPLVYMTPLYLFAYQMAVKRGFDPSSRRFPGLLALQVRYQKGQTH
jgi:glucosamine--fructose-6-phosphate aminotransferase (isomerizing)